MSRDEATAEERQLAALLAAYDDALAAGASPPAAPPALRGRLADNLACLHLLHQLRPDPAELGPATPPETGERYVLVRPHASGGIGDVWLAHDVDLGREVALKELRPERARDPAIAERFLREARVTGRLQHPGIVPVYELVPGNPGPDGRPADAPFYTMRFVQGRTLSDAARAYHDRLAAGTAGPLELTGLLNAFVSVCNTVAYAHSRGVIHRDLKGENVVLGDFGEVIVLDWGFAKLVGEKEDAESANGQVPASPPTQTLAGTVVGTPAYMAPEQAEGRADRIDVRTDVYGLGAILFEVLTGRPPFTGADSREVLRKARAGEFPRPEAIAPGAPPPLAAVCRRAMARDPDQRYQTPADLAREVQH
ncbi:MAG: serine/threonine protein kinase, partial [Zavarzinella sp.]|nr:serine/threonine protein kinase [Zavarzinella sp.]